MPKTLNEQRLAQILTKVKAEDDSVREEVSDLKSAFNSLVVQPTDYADVSASKFVKGNVNGTATATDASNGGVDVVNSSGYNGSVGFALTELDYTNGKKYTITIEFTNLVAAQDISLRRGMSNSSGGISLTSFTQDSSHSNIYHVDCDLSNYNHTVNGDLFVSFKLFYTQTTAVNVKITAVIYGDKGQVDNDYIKGIDLENLDTTLAEDIEGLKTDVDSQGSSIESLESMTEQATNFSEIQASDIVIGTSGLVGKVTATDNADADGSISLINTAGSNGTVGFYIDNLEYGRNKQYDITVTVVDVVGSPTLDIRRNFSQGNIGAIVNSLASQGDGVYSATFNLANWNTTNYGYATFCMSLSYAQTSAVKISISITEHNETGKTFFKPSVLHDIGIDNLSDSLQDAINTGGGSTPTTYGGKQFCTFNKGVAIGDSLTAGVFNHNEGGSMAYITNSAYSYPAKLKQITGVDITNLGNGGYTSAQWYTAHASDDLSGNQFAIIQLGVNDAIQNSGWTQESITAFTNIINKLLNENNGIFVFVATIIPATSYTGTAYTDVTNGIKALVESINNSHVILLDLAQYGNTGNEVGYNNGHLSALGYERLALDYLAYISYVISQNYTLFRNIQFIGTNYSYS